MPADNVMTKKEEVAKQQEDKETAIEDAKTKWKRRGKKLFNKSCKFTSLVIILGLIIHIEFKSLKEEETTRDTALKITENLRSSSEAMQDAWKTMYYFYKTGDLFKILRCSRGRTSIFDKEPGDSLAYIFKRPIDNNIRAGNAQLNPIACDKPLSINVQMKKRIDKKMDNPEPYTYVPGKEPLELLKKYPLIQYAVPKLKVGEKAVFIAMPQTISGQKFKSKYIYEIELPIQKGKNTYDKLPAWVPIYIREKSINVIDTVICNSIVALNMSIYNGLGQLLYETFDGAKQVDNLKDIKPFKFRMGAGEFNEYIEQILLGLSAGDKIKIFLTKNFMQTTPFFNQRSFDNQELLIIDLQIMGVTR
ncbi:MAG: hypothetical protein IJ590_03840 [Rickettsiales bacterium]|nr:hypothetical protein [Rickettsiales bacterium]